MSSKTASMAPAIEVAGLLFAAIPADDFSDGERALIAKGEAMHKRLTDAINSAGNDEQRISARRQYVTVRKQVEEDMCGALDTWLSMDNKQPLDLNRLLTRLEGDPKSRELEDTLFVFDSIKNLAERHRPGGTASSKSELKARRLMAAPQWANISKMAVIAKVRKQIDNIHDDINDYKTLNRLGRSEESQEQLQVIKAQWDGVKQRRFDNRAGVEDIAISFPGDSPGLTTALARLVDLQNDLLDPKRGGANKIKNKIRAVIPELESVVGQWKNILESNGQSAKRFEVQLKRIKSNLDSPRPTPG